MSDQNFKVSIPKTNLITATIRIPGAFLAGKPLQLSCDLSKKEANLYFLNNNGEWCLIAGTDDPDWDHNVNDSDFESFYNELQKIFDAASGEITFC